MQPSDAPVLFVSDLHLSPDRPGPLAAFHAFARGPAREARDVYILGDLFDWWIGDEQLEVPFVREVATSLKALADGGVRVHVARGNRDFLYGARFERETGAKLLDEQTLLELDGTRTLLLHGDELCTDDAEYQAYRTRIRSEAAKRRLLAMPAFVRRGIAWYLRRKSRNATALKPESITDVSAPAVADAFRRHDAARMIHGHTHRPARHALDVDGRARERVVLADWHDRGHVLALRDGTLSTYDLDGRVAAAADNPGTPVS